MPLIVHPISKCIAHGSERIKRTALMVPSEEGFQASTNGHEDCQNAKEKNDAPAICAQMILNGSLSCRHSPKHDYGQMHQCTVLMVLLGLLH
jgi:hypothetical protein